MRLTTLTFIAFDLNSAINSVDTMILELMKLSRKSRPGPSLRSFERVSALIWI